MENQTTNTEEIDYKEFVAERRAKVVSEMRDHISGENSQDKECTLFTVFYYAAMSVFMTERRAEMLRGHSDLALNTIASVINMIDTCVENGMLDDAKSESFSLNTYVCSIVNHLTGDEQEEGAELNETVLANIEKFKALDADVHAELVKMLMAVCAALYRVRYEHWTNAQMLQHIEHPENLTELIDPVVTYQWARMQGIRVLFYAEMDNIDLTEDEEAQTIEHIENLMEISEMALTDFLNIVQEDHLPASREWIEQFLAEHKEQAKIVFGATMCFYGLIPNYGIDLKNKLFDKEWVSDLYDRMCRGFFGPAVHPDVVDAELRPGFIYAMWISLFINTYSECLGKPLLCERGEAVDSIIHYSAECINKKFQTPVP